MSTTGTIEMEFDDVSHTYSAVWYPPKAIGSGKTQLEALRDLQEAIHFSVDTMIESRCEGLETGIEGGNPIRTQEELNRKALEIAALLPNKNCGACGFGDCSQFAMAVAQGKASPYDCRNVGETAKTISRIVGIDSAEEPVPADSSVGLSLAGFFRRNVPGMRPGNGRRRRRAPENSHRWFGARNHRGGNGRKW